MNKLDNDNADKLLPEFTFYAEKFLGDEKMNVRLSTQNDVFRLPPIQRQNDTELDVAIADLEKRGFTLVSRGKTPSRYNCDLTYRRVWAVMEKH